MVTGNGVAVSGGSQVPDKGRQGFGQLNGHGAEAELDVGGVCVDVVDGEPADRRGSLGVEQNQQAGDTVNGALELTP